MNDDFDLDQAAPWMVLFATVAGGFLRILLLDAKGLWLDETFSIWMAHLKIGEMLHWVVNIDQHPPLYYFLLHFWTAINGASPYAARLFSVLFGVGTIPIMYLIGKRISNQMMGVAAAVFFAFSPFNIFYAQEARMYTLLTFNAAVAIYALVHLLTDPRAKNPFGGQFKTYLAAWRSPAPIVAASDKPFTYKVETRLQKSWKTWLARHHWLPIHEISTDLSWVIFVLFSALTLYSHNTAVFFSAAVNIFVLGLLLFQGKARSDTRYSFQAPTFKNWIMAQIVILALWLPWLVPFIKQSTAVYHRFWIPAPTWENVVQLFATLINPSAPLPANLSTGIWIFFGVVFCLGLSLFWKKIVKVVFLIVLVAVPLGGELLVSIWRPIFFDRTLIWLTIPLLLILAAGISRLRFRILVILVLGSLVTINIFSVSDYFRFYRKEDWNTAARTVAGLAEDNDLVLFNSNFIEIPFNYYIESYETHQFLKLEKEGLPADLIKDGQLESEMTEADVPGLLSLLEGHDRVFLVYSHESYTDPSGLIPQTIASEMTLTRTTEFYGGVVQVYETP